MNTRIPAQTKVGLAIAAATLMALGACQPRSDAEQTVGQKVDGAVATAQNRADEIKADVKAGTAEARADAQTATAGAGDAVKDAAITVAVNGKLAADASLSALRINVDTTAGRVALSGDAPNDAARERATQLARSVDGVMDVDNRLTLQKQ